AWCTATPTGWWRSAMQRSPRPCGSESHQHALSARSRLANDRRPARSPATRPGRGRDRRVQRLLLARDRRRDSPRATVLERRAHRSGPVGHLDELELLVAALDDLLHDLA